MKSIEYEEELIHTDKKENFTNTTNSNKKAYYNESRYNNTNNIEVEQNENKDQNELNYIPSLEGDLNTNYIFRVEDDNYQLDKDVFKLLFPYICEMKHSFIERNSKIYLLPRSITKSTFKAFLNLIISNQRINFDLIQANKLIYVAEFFNFQPLMEKLIDECIFPSLEKNNCLRIIKEYIKKLYDNNTKRVFINLIQAAIDLASNNIFYLINNKYNELIGIGIDPLEEIIEHYFESVIFKNNIDNSIIMRLLINSRNLSDINDLLENERKRSITNFEKMHYDLDQKIQEPSIIWNIKCDKPTEGFYKESEEFQFEKISLVLINYYDQIKDTCSIAIKIKSILTESNQIESNHNNSIIGNDKNSQQYIISLLSICEIPEINLKTKINFNCIFTNLKSKVLICKIENFSQKFKNFDMLDYNLSIYFNISYNFSSILTHICRSFYEYYSLPTIGKLSKNVLNIILKYENINVRSEDEVLEAVSNWINAKNNLSLSKSHSVTDSIADIMKNVKWNLVSLDGLLDFILTESKLVLSYSEIQSLVIQEFQRRFKEEFHNQQQLNVSNLLVNNLNSSYVNNEQQEVSNKSALNKKSSDFAANLNLISSNNNTETTKKSFTGEFLVKLMKIASKYENNGYQMNSNMSSSRLQFTNNMNNKNENTKEMKVIDNKKGSKDSYALNNNNTNNSVGPGFSYSNNIQNPFNNNTNNFTNVSHHDRVRTSRSKNNKEEISINNTNATFNINNNRKSPDNHSMISAFNNNKNSNSNSALSKLRNQRTNANNAKINNTNSLQNINNVSSLASLNNYRMINNTNNSNNAETSKNKSQSKKLTRDTSLNNFGNRSQTKLMHMTNNHNTINRSNTKNSRDRSANISNKNNNNVNNVSDNTNSNYNTHSNNNNVQTNKQNSSVNTLLNYNYSKTNLNNRSGTAVQITNHNNNNNNSNNNNSNNNNSNNNNSNNNKQSNKNFFQSFVNSDLNLIKPTIMNKNTNSNTNQRNLGLVNKKQIQINDNNIEQNTLNAAKLLMMNNQKKKPNNGVVMNNHNNMLNHTIKKNYSFKKLNNMNNNDIRAKSAIQDRRTKA